MVHSPACKYLMNFLKKYMSVQYIMQFCDSEKQSYLGTYLLGKNIPVTSHTVISLNIHDMNLIFLWRKQKSFSC